MSKPPVLQRQRRTICQQGQQRGTTMIEVMVAALVLSAGLLGMAAMQTQALKTASGLATQQTMVQALGAFSEARLAVPYYNIVGGTGPDGNAKRLAVYCNSLWSGMEVNTGSDLTDSQLGDPPIPQDQSSIRLILFQNTSCGNAAITEYADYWNQFPSSDYGPGADKKNGAECDYIVPRTRTVSCTLPTGDLVSLHNRVWAR
jgi:type II secretory pathway pseudopilin PulG